MRMFILIFIIAQLYLHAQFKSCEINTCKVEALTYAGHNQFDQHFGRGVGRIKINVDSCSFNKSDSVLIVIGTMVIEDEGGTVVNDSISLLLGTFTNYPPQRISTTNGQTNKIYCTISKSWIIGSNDSFEIHTKVSPNQYLLSINNELDEAKYTWPCITDVFQLAKLF